MKEKYLFYTDFSRNKQILRGVTVICYICAIAGTLATIVFSLILTKDFAVHTDLKIEHIILIVLWWVTAILFNIYLVKSKKLKSYTAITEDKITFFAKGKQQTFDNIELICYEAKDVVGLTVCKLLFTENRKFIISVKKSQDLRNILDKVAQQK